MRLLLVRHGKAEFGPEEADRHLSARGRADVEAVAEHLKTQEITVGRVVHSTLSRARETAEILAEKIAPGVQLEELPGIEPWGNVTAFAKLAEKWTEDTMVCGHEPFMGEAVSYLMAGNAHAGMVEVKTGTVMALAHNPYGDSWQMRWMLTPRLVRGPKRGED
ncbi:phosphohistidine phosphatase SixA [Magnetovibrio sp.]|uniref:phosphohistidine phosphatase SixA n=1 Tax=Magnetovibrio sp. TaxID=2024836 RepID=UPI002F935188